MLTQKEEKSNNFSAKEEKFDIHLFYQLKDELFGQPERKKIGKRKGRKYRICPSCGERDLEISERNTGYTCRNGCSSSEVFKAAAKLFKDNSIQYKDVQKVEKKERPKGTPRPFTGTLNNNHKKVQKLAERYGISQVLARLNFGYTENSIALEEYLGYPVEKAIVSLCGGGMNNGNQVRIIRNGKGQWLSCKAEVTGEREFFKPRLPGNIDEYKGLYKRVLEEENQEIFFTEGLGKTLSLVENTKKAVFGAEGVNNLLSKKEFESLTKNRSKVIFAFDSDSNENWNVARAELDAGKKALENGTKEVIYLKWDESLGKGFDDFAKTCKKQEVDWKTLTKEFDFVSYISFLSNIFPEKIKEWKKSNRDPWDEAKEWANREIGRIKNFFSKKLDKETSPSDEAALLEKQKELKEKPIRYRKEKLALQFNKNKKRIIEYKGAERFSIWKEARESGFKYVLDLSFTGSGKSYAAGHLKNIPFELDGWIYASSQHRNPVTKELGVRWEDLPSRHNGLFEHPKLKNPDGRPVRKRPSKENPANICGNCKYADLFIEASKKNVNQEEAKKICNGCEFGKKIDDEGNILEHRCFTEEGDGFGYKNQRSKAIRFPLIRAHQSSLPLGDAEFYKNKGIFFDEFTSEALMRKDILITQEQVMADFNKIELKDEKLFNLISSIRKGLMKAFQEDLGRYGIGDLELRETIYKEVENNDPWFFETSIDDFQEIFDSINQILGNNIPNQIEKNDITDLKIKTQWLVSCINCLLDESFGAISLSSSGDFKIVIAEKRTKEIALSSAFNIFSDATGDPDLIAKMIGISRDEIIAIREGTPDHSHLKITNIKMDKQITNTERSRELNVRLNAIKSKIVKKHDIENVMFMDFKIHTFESDLVIFRDNRGTNRAADKEALIFTGNPYIHIGNAAEDFQIIYGKSPDIESEEFKDFYKKLMQAEMIQIIGRLRAARRQNKNLYFYYIGNMDLSFLEETLPGAKIKEVAPGDISIDAAPRKTRILNQIVRTAIYLNKASRKLSQEAIAGEIGISQNAISRWLKSLIPGGWKFLKDLIKNLSTSLLEESYREVDKNLKALESYSQEELGWIQEYLRPILIDAFAGGEIDGDILETAIVESFKKFGNKASKIFEWLPFEYIARILIWLLAQIGIDLEDFKGEDFLLSPSIPD